MKEGEFLNDMSPEDKKRTGYLEGKPELFRTKVLKIEGEQNGKAEKEIKNIVVEARDPGGANALLPILKLLQKDGNVEMKVIIDGRAEEIIQKNFGTKDITPQDNILKAAEVVGSPDLSLIGISEEAGIEMFVSATFPEVPSVLVEDYYGSSLGYLNRLKESNLPYPEKICVLDEVARDIILKKFPELADSIEVTGQPAFDRFSNEDTEKIALEVKQELGIKPGEKLVTFMSAMDGIEQVRKLAEELSKVKKDFKFTFRIHPRDNIPLEDYEREFKSRGVDCIETMHMPTDRVGAASDLVITAYSTEGLHAICRGKPSINIPDPRVAEIGEYLVPLPSVKLGASIGLDKMEDLAATVEKLLDPQSKESKVLKTAMKKNYPTDGKNSKRVVDVIKKVLNSKS